MNNNISKLIKVVNRLRDPKKGCSWDKKQTLETIIQHTIEEVHELKDEIYKKNYIGIKEELGDLLFQVVFLTQITKEKNKFDFDEVAKDISKKMIFRHPHLYSEKKFKNKKDHEIWWEKSKGKKLNSILDGIPKSYPSMLVSNKIQKKVASVGFDYNSNLEALNKIIEEANELKIELKTNDKKNIKDELGDLIFSCLVLSRKLKLDPEIILYRSNIKFKKRWEKLEKLVKKDKKKLINLSKKEYNLYWNKIKS